MIDNGIIGKLFNFQHFFSPFFIFFFFFFFFFFVDNYTSHLYQMYQDPRGGQGPAFRGTRRPSHVRRSSLEEIERTTSRSTARSMDGRSIRRLSHFQHHPRQHDHAVTPLHDPAGKPLRRHGTETIGDVLLHPFKELKLHHQREEAYELERREWNEKHPESAASVNDVENLNEESIM
jgi:hypothetical protein